MTSCSIPSFLFNDYYFFKILFVFSILALSIVTTTGLGSSTFFGG
jgi:hypothetical protein